MASFYQVGMQAEQFCPSKAELFLQQWLQHPHVAVALCPDSHDENRMGLGATGAGTAHGHRHDPSQHGGKVVPAGADFIGTTISRAMESIWRYLALRQFETPLFNHWPHFTPEKPCCH